MLLKALSERVYYLPNEEETDRPLLGYIHGNIQSLMIDAGNSPAHVERFVQGLSERGLPLPDYCVLTHWHWDHTFGICAVRRLESRPLILAGRSTWEKLAEVSAWEWTDEAMQERLETGTDIEFCDHRIRLEYPDRAAIRVENADISFDTGLDLDLGGLRVRLTAMDSPHSRDAVLVSIPEEHLVFCGDSASEDDYENGSAYDPARLAVFLRYLRQMDCKLAMLGHSGDPCPFPELVAYLEEQLAALIPALRIRAMCSDDVHALATAFLAQGWHDREEALLHYLADQNVGARQVFVAEYAGCPVGYVTLTPLAKNGPYAGKHPEICDFNVLEDYQRRGIGSALLSAAEQAAEKMADAVTLGVGLHRGYGPAQRMYVKRGYIPDGTGIWSNNKPATPYASVKNDDDLILYMKKTF